MKNVFWCLHGFNHGRLLLSYRFNSSDGFTISTVIMIDLESRFVYALWLSNLGRIFFSFNKLSSYEELSQVEFELQLQTDDKLSLYGHYNPCQKLISNSL